MTNLTLFANQNGQKIALRGASNVVAALRGSAQDTGGGDLPEGGVYISFSGKSGRYSIGPDKEQADPEEIWLLNIFEFQSGWMCWKGGAPVAKRLASIFGTPVEEPNMEEHGPFKTERGEGWSVAKALMMRSIERGIQGYYSTSTKSAVREFGKIEAEVARRLEEGLPAWPLIQLDMAEFTAQGQKNWKPVLFVAGWLAMQQVNKLAAAESTEEALAMLEDLVKEADQMEADGIPDSTLTGESDGDASEETLRQVREEEAAAEDDVEDAEVIPEEDDEDVQGAEADEEEEIPAAEEPAKPAPKGGLARRAARKEEAEAPKGGLRRRLGAK